MATKRRTSARKGKGSLASKTKKDLGKATTSRRRRRSKALETTW